MKRRYFIWFSILAGSVVAIPVVINNRLNAFKKPLIIPDMLSHFCDEETIRKIGIGYRTKFPLENNEKKLKELVIAGINGIRLANGDSYVIDEQLDRQIRDEFGSNEIVIIEGWVLTATEARQCALLSFTDKKS